MKYIDPISTHSWKNLCIHFKDMKNVHIKDLFFQDSERCKKFSINFNNIIYLDYSKNRITDTTLQYLFQLAKELFLKTEIKNMFNGKKINKTENQSVLHIALRNRNNSPIYVNNKNVMHDINIVLSKMKNFSESVINGNLRGFSKKKITDVVNIGIGGSDLGPYMVTESLKLYKNHLKVHFVSNLDGKHLLDVLKIVNPDTTIFLIVSKTFNTEETILNYLNAKEWFLKKNKIKNQELLNFHFFAVSENTKKVNSLGIPNENIFKFWKWVGGRYSLWSAAGLSISLSIGFDNFLKLLDGAHDMDNHFLHTKIEKNIPIILALISFWYSNFFLSETECILPYDQNLHRFPAYLQQANMESNGKSINRLGRKISCQSSPIIWGEPGTNGQHAFYQLLHQGTKLIPCDFIIPIFDDKSPSNNHVRLVSHFIAQTQALAFGNSSKEVYQELHDLGYNKKEINFILPFKLFSGNNPTNSIVLKKITPSILGSLICLYEHKIFVQGILSNIFSFDQWGVELGKNLSKKIYANLNNNKKIKEYDSSTNYLVNLYKKNIYNN
ncbi:glucose-6-phosphate isomerase [Buchnera aphidicola (Kurisakia onigurumii)]|uniref:glucose-6-phosphate isomerase n=1 Tax=Buchnera aphidicola TaxID=9 RepID=UPI0031B67BD7